MTRSRIAPRTYVDAAGRYWARFPVNRRYTWKLLREATTKRAAIAAAQTAGRETADTFAELAKLYRDASCPNGKLESRDAAFTREEIRRVERLIEYFGPRRAFGRAVEQVAKGLGFQHITPHGYRSFYVTKRRSDGEKDTVIAGEIGDRTAILMNAAYGSRPKAWSGRGEAMRWLPKEQLPGWLHWQATAAKIAQLL